MRTSDARVDGIIDIRIGHPGGVELRDTPAGAVTELVQRPELDRLGRAGLGAGGNEARLLTVVAERALERAAVVGPAVDDAERTGYDAVAAAVADVGLYVDAAELRPDDRAGGTRLEAARRLAMLADVGRERPGPPFRRIAAAARHDWLLDELHMPPGGVAERERVVVRETAPAQPVLGDVVPLLASHFARLAADAERGVSEEPRHGHREG
jgi:hypothetical protein